MWECGQERSGVHISISRYHIPRITRAFYRKTVAQSILVGEIKKDSAIKEDIDQLLKYVDWVKDEYCYGDYSMIDAFLVTYDFPKNVVRHKQNVGSRQYTIGVRPAQSLEWSNINLVKYSFQPQEGKLDFTLIES